VANNASFSGTSITLGDQASDAMNFDSLTVNTTGTGDVVINADSAISFAGSNAVGGNLTLTSASNIDAYFNNPSMTVAGGTTVSAPNGYVLLYYWTGAGLDFQGDVNISANQFIEVRDVNDIELGRLESTNSIVYVDAGGKITGNTPLADGCGVSAIPCGADIRVPAGSAIYLISNGAGSLGGIGDGAAVGSSWDAASLQKAIHIDANPASDTNTPGFLYLSASEGSKTFVTVNSAGQFTTLTTPAPGTSGAPVQVAIPILDTNGNIIGWSSSPPVSGMNMCYISGGPQCFNLFDLSPVTAAFDISGILNSASQDLFNSTFGTDNIRVAIQNGFLTEFGVVPPGIDAIDGDGVNVPVNNLVLLTDPPPPMLIDEEELKRRSTPK
jgi:hypothetical protein